MPEQSAIEQLIGRALDRETRGGVTHFVPGQLAAKRTDREQLALVELSYVDQMGHAWLILCVKMNGDWLRGGSYRGGQIVFGEDTPPELTELMVAALEAAE